MDYVHVVLDDIDSDIEDTGAERETTQPQQTPAISSRLNLTFPMNPVQLSLPRPCTTLPSTHLFAETSFSPTASAASGLCSE